MKLSDPRFKAELEKQRSEIAALPEAEKERMRQESREILRTQWKPTAMEEAAMQLGGQHL